MGEGVGASIELSSDTEDMVELAGVTAVVVDENVMAGVAIEEVLNNGIVVNARLEEPPVLEGELRHNIYSCRAAITLLYSSAALAGIW